MKKADVGPYCLKEDGKGDIKELIARSDEHSIDNSNSEGVCDNQVRLHFDNFERKYLPIDII